MPDLKSRWLALYVLCLGDLMIVLDSSIVNVALPSIQTDLGFSQAALAWVVNAYLLTFGGFLLLSGRLGDLLGNKRVFLGGTAFFTVASVACGLAPSAAWLSFSIVIPSTGPRWSAHGSKGATPTARSSCRKTPSGRPSSGGACAPGSARRARPSAARRPANECGRSRQSSTCRSVCRCSA